MSLRGDVPPATLGVAVEDGSVAVDYLDGRTVTYEVPPEPAGREVRCRPGKDVHVLVTDGAAEEGVLVYVNDRDTHDDVLRSSGVGRVLLSSGESTALFAGVEARVEGHVVVVTATDDAPGRVIVFEEDEMGERAYELGSEV